MQYCTVVLYCSTAAAFGQLYFSTVLQYSTTLQYYCTGRLYSHSAGALLKCAGPSTGTQMPLCCLHPTSPGGSPTVLSQHSV